MRISRRQFITDAALCTGGFRLIPLLGTSQVDAQTVGQGTAASLEQQFISPPADAWPWTYYYASNGNLTRDAITADLEAMHRVGICGILYMEVDLFIPDGSARFLSPEWRELMRHMMREADRLGITINFNNDGGWAGSGGPWITPELSMQVVVWSETMVEGPNAVSTPLAQPKTVQGYYKDIAVLAFPIPPGDGKRMMDSSPRLTLGENREEFDSSKLVDGNPGTVTILPTPPAGQRQCVNIDFPEPFTAQSVSVAVDIWDSGMGSLAGAVQVSDDGTHYRTVREMSLNWPNTSANFPAVSSRHYRILLGSAMMSNWSGYERALQHGLPLGGIELHAGPRIEDIPGKALYLRQGAYSTENDVLSVQAEFPEDAVIRLEQILDISGKVDSSGLLKWEPPPGKWVVLRLGHTSTGAENEPAPKESRGLECDKLSKRAIEAQFDGLIGKLLQDQATAGTNSFKMTHVDSWEVGSQNWTSDFRQEFQTRRGYDPLPYLVLLTARPIESGERSERFLWDMRRTIGDLLLENYAGHLKEICHKRGITLSIEGYGAGPLDEIAYGGQADVPMGEFWTGDDVSSATFNVSSKAMASSAHVYGLPVVAAEAFTAEEKFAVWAAHPFELKSLGDLAFTWGINRFVLNEFMVQPWPVTGPGITLGKWGSHLNRNNTWWEQSRPWTTYLARCQTLLQSGQFVADVAYLASENTPYSGPWTKDLEPPLPSGYDYDFLPVEVLLKDASVREGRLVLTSGMSYRLLVLQPGYSLTLALLRKLKQLVKDGLTVVGPRPVASPGLSDFPQCDAEVRQLADELWSVGDGSSLNQNRFGKGRVIWGEAISDVLVKLGAPPDFDCHETTVGAEIRFIHRRIAGDDFYFISSGVPEARKFLCSFRVGEKGRRPELWWPDSGKIEPISIFNEGTTRVGATAADTTIVDKITFPISLGPYGSVFVVFRASPEPQTDPIVSVRRNDVAAYGLNPVLHYQFDVTDVKRTADKQVVFEAGEKGRYDFVTAAGHSLQAEIPPLPAPFTIQGPWNLEFPKNLGAPSHVTLDRLISWTEHPDPGVKYFSGTAMYRSRFTLPEGVQGSNRRLYLDLGRVFVIAEVVLNGKDLGTLWKPPFLVDVTDAITTGRNILEVRVVNLWPNRFIGDEHLPEDCEWVTPETDRDPFPRSSGLVIERWPEWLLENKPRPSGRIAFTSWKHWTKDDPLLESGLLGPVQITAKARVKLT
jgi:hypothetical protein